MAAKRTDQRHSHGVDDSNGERHPANGSQDARGKVYKPPSEPTPKRTEYMAHFCEFSLCHGKSQSHETENKLVSNVCIHITH